MKGGTFIKNQTKSSNKLIIIFTGIITVAWITVSLLLIHVAIMTRDYQGKADELFVKYVAYNNVASAISKNFNIRTDNARGFVATGQRNFLEVYFTEEQDFANQHDFFNDMRAVEDDSNNWSDFETIMKSSSQLQQIEYHAIKLASVGFNIDESELPEQIRKYQLLDSELSLSPVEMREAATNMLTDREYNVVRSSSLSMFNEFINNTAATTSKNYEDTYAMLTDFIHQEVNYIIIDSIVLVLLLFLIVKLSYDRKRKDKELLDSMAINSTFASCYDSVILIDPDNYKISIVSYSDSYPKELEEAAKTGYFDYVLYHVNKIVFEDDRNLIIEKFTIENILNEIKNNKTYTITYRVQSSKNPAVAVYYRNEFLPFVDAKGKTKILCGGIIVDNEVREGLKNELNESLVESMANIVESRDLTTGNHIQHTRYYVSLIISELRKNDQFPDILTRNYCDTTIAGSVLHDVGKIYISDTILNKPGKLTSEEFEIMKKHPEYGAKVIENNLSHSLDESSQKTITDIVLYHHERIDGKGYPTGLKGNDIPLCARIMAVADVFDALVSKRPYKTAFSIDTAFDILEEEKGTHFDSVIVDAFKKVRPTIESFLESQNS